MLARLAICLVSSLLVVSARAEVFVLRNLTDVKGNNVIREIRIMYTGIENITAQHVRLLRGMPIFAEIDFVPRYFPSTMISVVASVMIPENIRRSRLGGPWIIGWNQEKIDPPTCRLCTNFNQSFTIPVTMFLPDDGWCPEGPIPTGWKLEASLQTSTPFSNSDMTIAMVIDQWAHIRVVNQPKSSHCQGIHEVIRYQVPDSLKNSTTTNSMSSTTSTVSTPTANTTTSDSTTMT